MSEAPCNQGWYPFALHYQSRSRFDHRCSYVYIPARFIPVLSMFGIQKLKTFDNRYNHVRKIQDRYGEFTPLTERGN